MFSLFVDESHVKACLVPVQNIFIFTMQIQHSLTWLVGPGRILKCLSLDLRIFKCLLSEIELNLNILLANFKVLVRTYRLKWDFASHRIFINITSHFQYSSIIILPEQLGYAEGRLVGNGWCTDDPLASVIAWHGDVTLVSTLCPGHSHVRVIQVGNAIIFVAASRL